MLKTKEDFEQHIKRLDDVIEQLEKFYNETYKLLYGCEPIRTQEIIEAEKKYAYMVYLENKIENMI